MQQDSRSLKALLTGESGHITSGNVLLEVFSKRGIVSGKWIFIANLLPEGLKATVDLLSAGWLGTNYYDNVRFREQVSHNVDKLFTHCFDEVQLYDLDTDPCE